MTVEVGGEELQGLEVDPCAAVAEGQGEDALFLVPHNYHPVLKTFSHPETQISPPSSSQEWKMIYPNTQYGHSSHLSARSDRSSVHIARIVLSSTTLRGRVPKPQQRLVKAKR
ncbi:MAG: hypothetical protein FRX48_03516 [Lasallia pustulata]|uniref:Uncharacterized protein n=1 Tax=Lasallia pustulata TaxID=136370 RepID=A0A5M8PU43_9LECA|nr:MAG: hypothetical protein FRX48_03516 [Lasallia pustulata]